jgi:hypothetical protein
METKNKKVHLYVLQKKTNQLFILKLSFEATRVEIQAVPWHRFQEGA